MENEKEKQKQIWFPKVGTDSAQKYFVEDVLLQKMEDAGLIKCAKYSDLVRWAIDEAAKKVGVKMETPTYQKKKSGRKKLGVFQV